MKKNDGWINALFSLVFIAAPALLLFFFFLPSWNGSERLTYGGVWGVVIGFLVYVALISFLAIKFEFLAIDSLNFNMPIALALMAILVTYPIPLWGTAIVVLGVVLFAFPVNIMVTKYKEHLILKARAKKTNIRIN